MTIKCEERYQEVIAHAANTEDKTLHVCIERLKQ